MGLFNKLFGNKKKDETGPMPTRNLNFQFSPIPENGLTFAEQFRSAVKAIDNIDLNFSIETLKFTDNFLQRFRDEGLTVNDFAETIFVAGCYIGQVMVHNNGGVWIKQEEANLPSGMTMMPIVMKLPNGTITDPIAKSFKRFYNGEEDSIPFYYHVLTAEKL